MEQRGDIVSWRRSGLEISTDPARLDLDAVHGFLAGSYWARGVPREIVERSCHHSLCFGVYRDGTLVGFARVTSDRATFAYLADVFVLESERGAGLGKWIVECVLAHPDLQGLRRWLLGTHDAHGLYEPFGFRQIARPDRMMEIHFPDRYTAPS